MAKKKNGKKNKNKKNNSPAVAPKAKFSASKANKNDSLKKTNKNMNKDRKFDERDVSSKNAQTFFAKLKPHKIKFIIAAIALIVIVVAVVLIIVGLSNKIPEIAVSEYLGQNATSSVVSEITVDEKTQLERYEEVRKSIKGNKKSFKFYARPYVEIDEKYLEGTIMFSNLTMNDCVMIVTIIDKDDDIIFRSMGIAPGKCMQRINLTKVLPFGEQEVRMYVTGYDRETFEIIGTQYMDLTLTIGSEYRASEENTITESTTNYPNTTRVVEATKATQATTTTTQPTTTTETTVKTTKSSQAK